MKALADVVLDLPGLCPAADSLAALTRPAAACWTAIGDDPAALALLLRHLPESDAVVDPTIALREDALLASALDIVTQNNLPFLDSSIPGVDTIRLIAARQAKLAAELAPRLQIDPRAAAACAALAPLGWFAIAAVCPERVLGDLDRCSARGLVLADAGVGHRSPATLTRAPVPGLATADLGRGRARQPGALHADQSRRLGADPNLVRVVQLAVLGVQQHGGLGLAIATPVSELLTAAGLDEDAFDHLVAECRRASPAARLESPRKQPLLADLLRLAVENRARSRSATWIDRLHRDLDRLHATLDAQQLEEQSRLKVQKLSALSEFRAPARATRSTTRSPTSFPGQAQYLMKQIEVADELLVEEPSPTLYLDHLRSKFDKSLHTIVGQTQRIHQVLMDLMHFARPQPSRPTLVPVTKLLADVVAQSRTLAEDRRVAVACPEVPATLGIRVDPLQIRLALGNLLKNAIEAAPADGYASLRVERRDRRHAVVRRRGQRPWPARRSPRAFVRPVLFRPIGRPRSRARTSRGMASRSPARRRRPLRCRGCRRDSLRPVAAG